MPSRAVKEKLAQDVALWQADGLISPETCATLRSRYDVPDLHRQLEMGMRALTLNFDVTSRIAADGRISSDDITLVLPDGSIIVPTVAELGQVTGGDDGGAVTPDRFVSFVVDEMPTGDFTLRLALDDRFVSEDGITEATFDFGL